MNGDSEEILLRCSNAVTDCTADIAITGYMQRQHRDQPELQMRLPHRHCWKHYCVFVACLLGVQCWT